MSGNYGRNHRNNPYIIDGVAGRFHHTMAGALWRWRTELTILSATAAGGLWLSNYLTAPGLPSRRSP